jgi:hypothetical protein
MKVSRRAAVIRREVKRLAAIAERRAAENLPETRGVPKSRETPSARFRPLSKAEAEMLLGAELLAALVAGGGAHTS